MFAIIPLANEASGRLLSIFTRVEQINMAVP